MSAPPLPEANAAVFLERASADLTELMHEVLDLVSDHDVYCKVQDVIKGNAKLLLAHSAFFDMMNDSFAYAATVRIRRIVDKNHRTISLLRLLEELEEYPELLDGKVTAAALQDDIRKLKESTERVKGYVDQYVAHHQRTPTADIPLYREVTRTIKIITDVFKKYYFVIRATDISLQVSYAEDPIAIFHFPWINSSAR